MTRTRAQNVTPGPGDPKPGVPGWKTRDWNAWWTEEIARLEPGRWEAKIRPMEAMMNRLGSLRLRGTRTILLHANGVSQEPRALSYAGFDVVALDISSVATRYAEGFSLPESELRLFFQWDDIGQEGAFERARGEGGRHRFVCGDAFDASVEPGPFDAIFSWRGFHGYTDAEMESLARALDRRLSPAGSINISVQNAPRTCSFLIELFTELGYAVNGGATTGRIARIRIASG